MKQPQPDLYNLRVIHFARQFFSLPFLVASQTYQWVRARVAGPRSAKAIHHKDQLRQSRARRVLRGLPADHDAGRTSTR